MKSLISIVGFLVAILPHLSVSAAEPAFLDLKPLFDTDVFLETGGAGLSPELDATHRRIDAGSLPASFSDGTVVTTVDGAARFKLAPLKLASLDALKVHGQLLDVPDGSYRSVDLAILAAPGSYADPFSVVTFRYLDGTEEKQRLGPVPGWFASPTAFDHTWFNYTDSSSVQTLVSFKTDGGDDEAVYLAQAQGNGNSGGNRFVDAAGYALYRIPITSDITAATLGITVGNNFVVSLATEFHDPAESVTDGYTEVLNSMKLYEGFEHRALGNLKLYEVDLQPYLAKKSGEIYVLFTDATPNNGWGPYMQNLSVYTGQNVTFAQTLIPNLKTNNATVYAAFLTDGGVAEKPYLYDNSGSGPSNRHHRFADGSGSITYRFDLPDDVDSAKLTVDMANNFVVSISGSSSLVRYAHVSAGEAAEKDFLVDDGNSVLGSGFRFADGGAYMVYQFDLPDDVTSAVAQISVGNQFVVGLAGPDGEFETVKDWVAETGAEPRDLSNFSVYEFPLATYLKNNPQKVIRIRLSDGQPGDGWGPYLTGITIANEGGTGQQSFSKMLNAQELFGADVHDEFNKGYYTIDLSSVLTVANSKKEVYVKFTDQSTGDGWGPGIFWMAVYRGAIEIETDGPVFDHLKTLDSEPAYNGVNLLRRSYPLAPGKVLREIQLPQGAALETSSVYLLAATLNSPPVAGQPTLRVELQGNAIQLSWPSAVVGAVLQSTSALGQAWSVDTTPTNVQGSDVVAKITLNGQARFYRLSTP